MVLLDGGNLGTDHQKAEVIFQSLAALRYDAICPGPTDSAWLDSRTELACSRHVAIVRDAPAAEAVAIVRNVAVTCASPSGPDPETVGERLRTHMARARLAVVLSHQSLERSRQIATLLGRRKWRAIVLVCGPKQPAAPERHAAAWLLPSPIHASQVAVAEVSDDGLRFHVASADMSLRQHPAVRALVSEYYRQERESLRTTTQQSQPTPADYGYVTARRCSECHLAAYRVWKDTRHATAVQTLQQRDRLVPECLRCHSERYRRGGAASEKRDDADGVQCATCHGDGVLHALTQRGEHINRPSGTDACVGCHKAGKMAREEFDYRHAWSAIRHGK